MHDASELRWDAEMVDLLTQLSATQDELLTLLSDKRRCLMAADAPGMQALEPREDALLVRLQACLDQRDRLLERATDEGHSAPDLKSLAAVLPFKERQEVQPRLDAAAHRARLLRHHSLTNWVLVQRTLLHLSQLLEIIATGGRQRPTYGKGEPVNASGSLVDQAA